MKIRILTFVLILMILSCSCSPHNKKIEKSVLTFNSFNIIEKEVPGLNGLGRIKKVIKLQTTEDSLIGSIDSVIVDPANGDVLIGDFRNRKKVLRFSSQGKYIRSYGTFGQGPFEYLSLLNFDIMSNGDVVLLTNMKLMKFSRQGEPLKEIRSGFYASHLKIINDVIYIPVIEYRLVPEVKYQILMLDAFFVNIGGFGDYDSRLEKITHIPANALAKKDKTLYYTDIYDLSVNIYDTSASTLTFLPIPNANSNLETLWKKTRLTQTDEQKILVRLQRFENIFSLDDRLLLFEHCIEKKMFKVWLMNLVKKEIIVFDWQDLYGTFGARDKGDLFFNRITGSYENHLIGAFYDEEAFNRFKHKYSILQNIQFKADDNPVIAFFEFNRLDRFGR